MRHLIDIIDAVGIWAWRIGFAGAALWALGWLVFYLRAVYSGKRP